VLSTWLLLLLLVSLLLLGPVSMAPVLLLLLLLPSLLLLQLLLLPSVPAAGTASGAAAVDALLSASVAAGAGWALHTQGAGSLGLLVGTGTAAPVGTRTRLLAVAFVVAKLQDAVELAARLLVTGRAVNAVWHWAAHMVCMVLHHAAVAALRGIKADEARPCTDTASSDQSNPRPFTVPTPSWATEQRSACRQLVPE
jgi:hypothetical protein